jgi:hypothetical protein
VISAKTIRLSSAGRLVPNLHQKMLNRWIGVGFWCVRLLLSCYLLGYAWLRTQAPVTISISTVTRASSTVRCNTIQRIDSAMLPRENHLLGGTRPKVSQGSVPAGLTLASGFDFCFQCQGDSSLVLRRPIETTRRNIKGRPDWSRF